MVKKTLPGGSGGKPADPLAPEKECILCGRCLAVCPLFRTTGREELSPKAKQQLARTLLENPAELDEQRAADLASLCLGCGLCEQACPQGLCAPDLVAALRQAHPDWTSWVWETWLGRHGQLWPGVGLAARVSGVLAKRGIKPGGMAARALRSMQPQSAVTPWLRLEPAPGTDAKRVALFPGCLGAHIRTDWVEKSYRLLRVMGHEVLDPLGWECCGCSVGHAGLMDLQRRMREANLEAWRAAGRPDVAIYCATCRCGLRAYATDDSLDWAPGEREQWRRAFRPLAAYLDQGHVRTLGPAPGPVRYHQPCHGRRGDRDLPWMQRVLGETLAAFTREQCCGMGGVFQLAAPELSEQVGREALKTLGVRAGEIVATGCSGCVAQFRGIAPVGVRVAHWLEFFE